MGGETRRKGRLPPRRKPARCLRPSQFRRRRPQSSYPWQKPSKGRRTHVRPPSNSGGSGVTAPAARSVLPKEEGCPTAVQQGFVLSEPARHGGPDPAPGSPAVCSTVLARAEEPSQRGRREAVLLARLYVFHSHRGGRPPRAP